MFLNPVYKTQALCVMMKPFFSFFLLFSFHCLLPNDFLLNFLYNIGYKCMIIWDTHLKHESKIETGPSNTGTVVWHNCLS